MMKFHHKTERNSPREYHTELSQTPHMWTTSRIRTSSTSGPFCINYLDQVIKRRWDSSWRESTFEFRRDSIESIDEERRTKRRTKRRMKRQMDTQSNRRRPGWRDFHEEESHRRISLEDRNYIRVRLRDTSRWNIWNIFYHTSYYKQFASLHYGMPAKRLSPAEFGRSGKQLVRALVSGFVLADLLPACQATWMPLYMLAEEIRRERKKIEKVWRFALMSNVVQANMLPTQKSARNRLHCSLLPVDVAAASAGWSEFWFADSLERLLRSASRDSSERCPRTIRKTGTDYGSPIQITRARSPSNRSRSHSSGS